MYKCQSCGSDSCVKILDLGEQPICNKFLKSEGEFKTEKFYPLELIFCRRCTLVQLSLVPPASEVFSDSFDYLSGYTSELVKNFNELAAKFKKDYNLTSNDYVVDIGSNDGTFLQPLHDMGVKVLGVEPTPIPANVANKKGLTTINKRFEDCIDQVISTCNGRIKLITAFNVFAHTDTIHEFLDGVKKILEKNKAGFIIQTHYLKSVIDKREYDSIYHEHARYYTLTSLKYLLEMHGIKIYDVAETSIHGGSLLVYADLGASKPTAAVAEMLKNEKRFADMKTYEEFAQHVEENRQKLRFILTNLKKRGKRIVGVGTPMKSSTMLNYCGIDSKIIDYLGDINVLRIGSYSPGTHIKIVPEENIIIDKPDAALILSWNVAEKIMGNLRKKGYSGSFIVPMPIPTMVE